MIESNTEQRALRHGIQTLDTMEKVQLSTEQYIDELDEVQTLVQLRQRLPELELSQLKMLKFKALCNKQVEVEEDVVTILSEMLINM